MWSYNATKNPIKMFFGTGQKEFSSKEGFQRNVHGLYRSNGYAFGSRFFEIGSDHDGGEHAYRDDMDADGV
jgi:hypothetical protein